MNKRILILMAVIIIQSVFIAPFSISAEDESYLTKEEKAFDFILFVRVDRASKYIASLRTWSDNCSSKLKWTIKPEGMSFPDKEFNQYKTCFLGDENADVPDTMSDIADLWNAEVCLKFDSISRTIDSLKKGANLWEWTTGLEQIKGHLNSIESTLSKIRAMQKKRKLELETKRKLEEEVKKKAGLKDESCFIATAAYGTPAARQIDVLRRFRDEYMQTISPGKAFIRFYYDNSPPVAAFISEYEVLRIVIREGLVEPAVKVVELTEYYWSDKASQHDKWDRIK